MKGPIPTIAFMFSATAVNIETNWHNVPEFNPDSWFEYTLMAATRSVPQFDFSGQTWVSPQMLHSF
jgi:hypothetical protein